MKQEKTFVPVFRNPSYKGKKENDIVGKRFGHLVAMKRTGTYAAPCGVTVPIWLFKCDCGKEVEMNKHMVVCGSAVSCGCQKRSYTPNDYYIEGDVMHVITTRGEFIVDAADKDLVLQHRWFIGNNGYAFSSHKQTLHKLLMNPKEGVVDHINRNKLDNRRCNLRVVSQSVNSTNKTSKTNTGHYGISFTKNGFIVYVMRTYVGFFKTLDEAIEKRNSHPKFKDLVAIRGDVV